MISHKFDERMGGWCSCEERKGYGVGLWKERQAKFQARNSFEVCNGRTVGELGFDMTCVVVIFPPSFFSLRALYPAL